MLPDASWIYHFIPAIGAISETAHPDKNKLETGCQARYMMGHEQSIRHV